MSTAPLSTADLFRRAPVKTDRRAYRMLHLPLEAVTAAAGIVAQLREPFLALLVDAAEVTLVLPEDALDGLRSRVKDARISEPFALITFDLPLDAGVIGFMALVSRALADAGVSIMPYAAFERDHILVPYTRLDDALAVLRAAASNSGPNNGGA